jgi:hypothetical protein
MGAEPGVCPWKSGIDRPHQIGTGRSSGSGARARKMSRAGAESLKKGFVALLMLVMGWRPCASCMRR